MYSFLAVDFGLVTFLAVTLSWTLPPVHARTRQSGLLYMNSRLYLMIGHQVNMELDDTTFI